LSRLIQPVKNVLFLTGFFILAISLQACDAPAVNGVAFEGYTMGTSYHIKIIDDNVEDAEQLQLEVNARLLKINQLFSTYIADSEVSKLNRYNETEWRDASAEFVTVTKEALAISEITAGAYDITVGPLVNLWGFGPDFSEGDIPSDVDIQQALSNIGFQYLVLDDAAKRLKKTKPSLYVDFSSIAKGYGVDQVAKLLEAKGYRHYMVEIGGEMRLSGHNSEGSLWRIAVEKPDATTRAIQRVINITDTAIATSGDYRNFFVKDGLRYSHTVDPITGRPVKHTLASVTVLAKSSMSADAWATALMVLGHKKGYDLAMENELAVLFLVNNGDSVKEVMTPYFQHIIEEHSS